MGGMSRWLDVEEGTNDVRLDTIPSNIGIADLNNDNEFKLLVGDMGNSEEPKLKIFEGAMLISDINLPDVPLSVVSFYASETQPKPPPLVAVAFNSRIDIYRNFKVFYRFQLPSIKIEESEIEIWKQLKDPTNYNDTSVTRLCEELESLSNDLCYQSKTFLLMTIEEKLSFLETAELPNEIPTEFVCLTTLKMSALDKMAVSCLVVGTEDGDIIVLDPHTFTQLLKANLNTVKSQPYQIVATGLYNTEYRITIATR
ncbi:unnamed protein product [Leptosia nina]|uniref:Bardet-Biedl syndrome 1 N-terminal domain-containing protein n=1 Tax=Leptosia nina TaxID=320188 RepID=A0AAV1JWV7_9NEOP